MITAKSSKLELIRTFNSLTVSKIVAEHYPCVGVLAKSYGNEVVENCIAVIIADLNETFDGDLSKEKIDEITIEINSSMLRNHSLESIFLACKNLKSADVYGKLTVNKVLKELHKTFNEISDATALVNYNKHLATKHHEPRETVQEQRKKASQKLSEAVVFMEIQKQIKQ